MSCFCEQKTFVKRFLKKGVGGRLYKCQKEYYSKPCCDVDHCVLYHICTSYICSTYKMYSSKLQNVFVQIAKCLGTERPTPTSLPEFIYLKKKIICPNCKIDFSILWNVFVQIAKYICPKCRYRVTNINQSSWVHLAAFIVPALLLSFLINIPKVCLPRQSFIKNLCFFVMERVLHSS